MTFVFPFLLGGLLLAGVPVLLHFLVRKKPKAMVFPAFQFLMEKQRKSTRNLRLKHLLLLLMRMALIALLCLALARPRLFHESLGLSREKPVALVLVFDTTPSMKYKVGDVTRLDFAKKRALELLDQLPDEGRFLVLDASDPTSREEWSKSIEKARQRVKSLTIRPQSVPVTRGIDEALRRCEQLEGAERMPRFVCVFSDRTRVSWDASPNTKSHPHVKLLYFDIGVDDPVDFALTQIDFPRGRQSLAQGETVELNVTVKATGADMSNTVTCRLGKQEWVQPIDLAKGSQRSLEFKIPTDKLTPGFHHIEMRLGTENDALAFNNIRFATFAIHKKPRVLVLADEPAMVDDFAFALEVLNHEVDSKKPPEKLALHEYAAVFVIDVAAPSDALWQALTTYAQERGVCVIPGGERLQREAYNSAAARLLLPATFGDSVKNDLGIAWNLRGSRLLHPFMQPFHAWIDLPAIDFLRHERRAKQYWHVTPQKTKDVSRPVDYQDGNPAVLERTLTKGGKVLLLTTPLDDRQPAWNNYAERITSWYVTLTSLCARHLIAPPSDVKVNHVFGQAPAIVRQDLSLPKTTLIGPDVSDEIRFDDKQQWTGDRLTKAGHYTVIGSNPEQQRTEVLAGFSMNEASDESDLTRLAKEDVEAALGKDTVIAQDRGTSLLDSIRGHWDEPVELFPWLMIGLLFLLALENLLANRFYRTSEPSA